MGSLRKYLHPIIMLIVFESVVTDNSRKGENAPDVSCVWSVYGTVPKRRFDMTCRLER